MNYSLISLYSFGIPLCVRTSDVGEKRHSVSKDSKISFILPINLQIFKRDQEMEALYSFPRQFLPVLYRLSIFTSRKTDLSLSCAGFCPLTPLLTTRDMVIRLILSSLQLLDTYFKTVISSLMLLSRRLRKPDFSIPCRSFFNLLNIYFSSSSQLTYSCIQTLNPGG